MKVWSRGSMGNEGMFKEVGRWGMKVWSRGSLGNEGMVKGVAGE